MRAGTLRAGSRPTAAGAGARPRRPLLVVIRGPLGAGKTTIATRLARRLGGRYISIDRILEERDLERWEGGYVSEGSFLAANRYAARAAAIARRKGRPVVVDGNFYFRTVIVDLLGQVPPPHVVVTLDLPLRDCEARDRERRAPFGARAVREVFRKATGFRYGIRLDARGGISEVEARLHRELATRGGRAAGAVRAGKHLSSAAPGLRAARPRGPKRTRASRSRSFRGRGGSSRPPET